MCFRASEPARISLMATSLEQTITFDDWSKGEWSVLGEIKAQPGSFTATNMIVRANGTIGPRAGLKNVTPASMPNGLLLALEAGPTPGKDGLFIIGNTVYYFDLFTPATSPTSMGTLGTTPSVVLAPFLATTKFYVAVPGDATYELDPIAGTTTALTDSPGGHIVLQFGARLLVAESTSSNRLFVSDPSDFNSWPVDNFIDIGDDWQITAMIVQKNQLAIIKREGIYVLSGTPTVSEFVRRVDTMTGPLQPWQARADQDDTVYFIQAFGRNPAIFDGTDGQQISYLKALDGARDDTDPTPPTQRGVETIDGETTASTVVYANRDVGGSDVLVVKHNNTWTKHVTSVGISGMTTTANGQFVITDGGGSSTPAKIYTTRFDLGRPAFTSDGLASVGDDSSTPLVANLTLPEWRSPDGMEVGVESVLIDGIKWNTGATATNHAEVTVFSLAGFMRPGKQATVTQSFDEAGSSASTGGTEVRLQFNFEDIRGGGFQIVIENIRGLDIRSVEVTLANNPNLSRH